MKILLTLILLFSLNSFASVKFWEQVREGNIEQFHRKMINLSGEVVEFKRKLKPRDTIFYIKVKDPKGKSQVMIKLFTVKKLKKINDLECKKGQQIFARIKFMKKSKSDQIGYAEIEEPNDTLKCFKVKKIES